MARKKNPTSNAQATPTNMGPASGTPENQPAKKKPPILWDKDGTDGISSIRILLDWLAAEGNYERWRGDNKKGLTKAGLANEILELMKAAGITHRDSKGIQTKVQELQTAYGKASDFLCNSGSGLQDDHIANGTTTLQSKLIF